MLCNSFNVTRLKEIVLTFLRVMNSLLRNAGRTFPQQALLYVYGYISYLIAVLKVLFKNASITGNSIHFKSEKRLFKSILHFEWFSSQVTLVVGQGSVLMWIHVNPPCLEDPVLNVSPVRVKSRAEEQSGEHADALIHFAK